MNYNQAKPLLQRHQVNNFMLDSAEAISAHCSQSIEYSIHDDNVSFENFGNQKTKSKNDAEEIVRPPSPIHTVKSLIGETKKLPSHDAG